MASSGRKCLPVGRQRDRRLLPYRAPAHQFAAHLDRRLARVVQRRRRADPSLAAPRREQRVPDGRGRPGARRYRNRDVVESPHARVEVVSRACPALPVRQLFYAPFQFVRQVFQHGDPVLQTPDLEFDLPACVVRMDLHVGHGRQFQLPSRAQFRRRFALDFVQPARVQVVNAKEVGIGSHGRTLHLLDQELDPRFDRADQTFARVVPFLLSDPQRPLRPIPFHRKLLQLRENVGFAPLVLCHLSPAEFLHELVPAALVVLPFLVRRPVVVASDFEPALPVVHDLRLVHLRSEPGRSASGAQDHGPQGQPQDHGRSRCGPSRAVHDSIRYFSSL